MFVRRHALWLLLLLCLLALVEYGSAAKKGCKVEKAPKFDTFEKKLRNRYPQDAIRKALDDNEEANTVVTTVVETAPDERVPFDVAWHDVCPEKYTDVYKYGVTDDGDQCWVVQHLWYASCKAKKCDYTIQDVFYFRCRRHYTPVSFWVYCQKADRDRELRVLTMYLPRHCECRRYFCPGYQPAPPEPE